MKKSYTYQSIDMEKTGLLIKKYMDCAGMSVKDIQEYLHLSCPQPVYRWIKGKILPSVDHLLSLSVIFGVHMEDLLVREQKTIVSVNEEYYTKMFQKRLFSYFKLFI